MADNTGISERKGKKRVSLLIDVKFGTGKKRTRFTKTIHVNDYPSKTVAYTAARHIRDQARLDYANSRLLPNRVPTVRELYLRKWELSGSSIKTKERQDSIFQSCLSQFSDVPLDEVSVADIQRSLVLYAENHSQDLVKRAITIWRQIYQCAIIEGINIADKTVLLKPVKSKKIHKPRTHETDRETFLRFSDALLSYNAKDGKPCKPSQDIWYLLQIMYWTGCRVGEVLALDKNDYDPVRHILSVTKAVGSTSSNKRVVITTKTADSVREIPCTEELESVLRSLFEYSDTSPLLLYTDGKPYEIDYVSNYIHLVSMKSKIRFNAYMLRHLFSTSLFRSGQSSAVIRDLMGHASSTMSLEYASSSEEERAEAVRKRTE